MSKFRLYVGVGKFLRGVCFCVNQGAVGVKLSAFRRIICLVNSHFAAHMEKVSSRNSDFDYCYNQMTFGPKPSTVAFGSGGAHQTLFENLENLYLSPNFHVFYQ